ncbi:hypothetical protein HRR83_007577 [Exophiala dermatitidis]|uniref:Major facilitator superfamily (MFS) profile domain-containing protein n=1 Tax=Exophiala dermatitidis TaxID=5970 RepID=A0AAN6ISC6_EXODE|nr:hypothetical protein HRR75_006597 [Exophiala dermatitidis]KAJ4510033.1 hypothetical protein HRR74_007185 [Exophiala dermatitidis]KAJ4521715.1 hypothetical protein HRR73_002913 [Exophiala dermatitidis]KAJ4539407.1 hypothetical protein HRR77_006294 [Exophiala dermatitidis]KAJ4542802.1 hypothetical protein HRR78_006891 [Exophiala dermatitidis]
MSSVPVEPGFRASLEKGETAQLEQALSSRSEESIDEDPEFSPAEQRKIIHKVDRRLIVTCGLMYCISLMDRTNLSAAAIAGMTKELKLIDFRYSTIALVFFATYVVCQPPATVLCRKIGPRPFLACITFAWGVVMIGFGFPKNWTTMLGLRMVLGVLEAGFFPGTVYLISTWYSRYDLQKRYSVFYLIGCLAAACSGILAYGLMQMDGIAGYRGWRWIFILEGVMTCLVGIIGYFFLVDFPDRAAKTAWHFLSERECNFIIRRIAKDRDDAQVEPFSFKKWAASGLDPKVWGFAMIFFCLTTITYAIAYFLPIILRENMGFSVGAAQCLVAPPYAVAGILMYTTSWLSDKYRLRGPILALNAIICLIGLPVMGYAKNSGVRYFGVFLTTAGANASIPCCMAWQANNIRGQWKRAFCSALLVGFGGIGGISGSLVFRSQDAPQYRPGIYAAIACCCLILVIIVTLETHFFISNRKVDKGRKVIEGLHGFRYTY